MEKQSMFSEIHDISVPLSRETIEYPGDTPFRRTALMRIEEGAAYELARLEMSAHAGTHLDAPAHFVTGGKRIDAYSAGELIFPAHVVDVAAEVAVGTSDIADLDLDAGDAVLFKTANSRAGRCRSGRFTADYVSLSAEAARSLAEQRVGLVGIDYLSIDPPDDDTHPAHHALLGAGALVLEGIDLRAVPEGRYTLICLPLAIASGEAAPTRAILVR